MGEVHARCKLFVRNCAIACPQRCQRSSSVTELRKKSVNLSPVGHPTGGKFPTRIQLYLHILDRTDVSRLGDATVHLHALRNTPVLGIRSKNNPWAEQIECVHQLRRILTRETKRAAT